VIVLQHVILQALATHNSLPFYETFGFIRVGAVAKYREKTAQQLAQASKRPPDKSNSKKRRGSEGDDAEVNLPEWLRNKRFKFFVGGSGGAAAQEFFVFVDKEWEPEKGFRLYNRFRDGNGLLKYQKWRSALELGQVEVGMQRFLPEKLHTTSKPFPPAHVYKVAVQWRQKDDKGKKAVDYIEIVGENEAVSAAYVQLNEASAQSSGQRAPGKVHNKPKPGGIDWNDHSDVNVERRRAAGFVPYCHWTFPEQSVEDICPSYMMARRLLKKVPPPGGAIECLRSRMRDTIPEKKRTREDPPSEPVHTGHNYDDVSAESLKKSMYNKVSTPLCTFSSRAFMPVYVLCVARDFLMA
jgi:hypothetical protein